MICLNVRCAKNFKPVNKNQIYCSPECRLLIQAQTQLRKYHLIEAEKKKKNKWVQLYKNSSMDALREIANLPPLELKEKSLSGDLFSHIEIRSQI